MGRRGLTSFACVLLLAACGGGTGGGDAANPGGGGSGGESGTGGLAEAGGSGGAVDPTAPRIDALAPDAAGIGAIVELRGANLQAHRELSVIFRPGVSAPAVAADRDGAWIRTYVPAGATSGPVSLWLDGAGYAGPSFTVTGDLPAPRLEEVRPDHVMAGAPATDVRLRGWGFCPESRVFFDEQELAPTAAAVDELAVVLPASVLGSRGRHRFRVENPAPGGGSSESRTFDVAELYNLVEAVPLDANTVRLAFDRQPAQPDAVSIFSYHFECFS